MIDIEPVEQYVQPAEHGADGLRLEPVDSYVKRVKATISLSKARAANLVAYIMVIGVVSALPIYAVLYVILATSGHSDSTGELGAVFTKWFDVVGPLLGAVIGALFGLSVAARQKD